MKILWRRRCIFQHKSRRLTKASVFILLTLVVAESGISQSKDELALRRKSFASGRALLLEKGVPFNPDDLLYRDWPKRLKPVLDSMPEMKQVRRETGPLQGVYIANTLYLRESTSLAGNTVIIAKYLVYEGDNPGISGPHDLSLFVVEPKAVLGTSLAEVLQHNAVRPEIRQYADSLPPFDILKKFVNIQPHTIGVNVSGSKGEKGQKGAHGTDGANGKKGEDGNQSF